MWQKLESDLEAKNWDLKGEPKAIQVIGKIIKEHPTKVTEPD